jgi:uncharacterized protein involved in exopolysaccharide biosynthesis
MNAPPSMIGTLTHVRLFSRFWVRAAVFATLIAVALVFTFYPERYRAAVSLTPTDPQSLGLSGTLGQLGAINNVFGNQAAVEVAIRIARSELARDYVINKTHLAQRLKENDRIKLHRWLDDKVTIRSLRGGIVLIEMQSENPDLARDIVGAYADATQQRLADISRKQTAYKRDVLIQLVNEASQQLSVAQARYDHFRLQNRAPSPMTAVEAVSERIPQLEAAIKAKQVDLAAARQLYTDQNNIVRQLSAELAALQRQLVELKATGPSDDATVGRAVSSSSQLFKLERDLGIARALYDNYLRYLQGTAVEDLTSTANIRILEPPYVDTERQLWLPSLALAIALGMLWAAIEFYRMRPPPGDRVLRIETLQTHA